MRQCYDQLTNLIGHVTLPSVSDWMMTLHLVQGWKCYLRYALATTIIGRKAELALQQVNPAD